MKNIFSKAFNSKQALSAKTYIISHKIISTVGLIIILGGGYYAYAKTTSTTGETRYVLGTVTRGTLITTISGSGQVSASNQVDVKPKASGDVVYIGVEAGQAVKAGTLIATLDSTDAQKAVRDAEANLESAQISLEKIQQPADDLSKIQAENSLTQAKQSKENAISDLAKAYDDAFTAISNAYGNLPTVMTGLQDVLYKMSYNGSQDNISYYADLVKNYDENVSIYKNSAASTYTTARTSYDKSFLDYKAASRYSDQTTIKSLLNETYTSGKTIAEALKNTDNLLSFVKDELTQHNANISSQLTTHQTNVQTYTSTINSTLSNLLGSINSVKNAEDAIKNADLSIQEKTASLAKLMAGTDTLDLRSSQLSLAQRQNALEDAQSNLGNYYIRAPFDGVIGKLSVKKSDSASSGTSVATLITNQRIAEISLNEVDVSKVNVGDKVNLTFDAVDGLNITGSVAEIDAIGTVSQGVVTYNVKISFDTQDDRIKPGMSVSASVITDAKPDVLLVPNSALKINGQTQYVEVFNPALSNTGNNTGATAGVASSILPTQQVVEIGASNDTETEIISGLTEGEQIVTRTTIATTKTTAAAPSATSLLGGTRAASTGGGGNVRFQAR